MNRYTMTQVSTRKSTTLPTSNLTEAIHYVRGLAREWFDGSDIQIDIDSDTATVTVGGEVITLTL